MRVPFLILTACAVFVAVFAAPAAAAPPANDMRTAATALSVPQTVHGTTVEASGEIGEPSPSCASSTGRSVWYSIKGRGKRVSLGLTADGDLDATIAVFERVRSQTQEVDCAITDRKGLGVLAFKAKDDTDYLVVVEPRGGSVDGTFTLSSAVAADPQDFPGSDLPNGGASRSVNIASNPGDVWAVHMNAGTTYRINLATSSDDGYCVKATLFSKSGQGDLEKSLSCNRGYTLFTPRGGKGGRYSIKVDPSKGTLANQKYHLQVGRAGFDDTGPGRFWAGLSIGGYLDGGGIDAEDLYNWDLTHKSSVNIRVSGGFDVNVLSVGGRRLGCTCDDSFPRILKPGTYFASVFASNGARGSYTLRRTVKSITHTSVGFNGSKHALAAPGQSVSITGSVTPASVGGVKITLERKDPVYGWQYQQTFYASGSGGSFSVGFTPSGVGEWRATAEFRGSHSANPSSSGYAHLSVRR